MGYYSRFVGELAFSRELTHAEVKAFDGTEQELFGLNTWEDEQETENGVLVKKAADSIEVKYKDSTKGYQALDELQSLCYLIPTDIEVIGSIRRIGEQSPDVSQYAPVRTKASQKWTVEEQRPRLVWPDGTTEPVR